jgi:hypothetical protein
MYVPPGLVKEKLCQVLFENGKQDVPQNHCSRRGDLNILDLFRQIKWYAFTLHNTLLGSTHMYFK